MAGISVMVTGSPGSGKTLTAVKTATALADFRRKVILVCCDEQVPAIPLLIPGADDVPSLASLLRQPEISPITALKHCIPFGKSGLIGLLGYRIGDQSPPEGYMEREAQLLFALRSCADYIVFDCSLENRLAGPLLNDGTICFRLLNANLKSFVYYSVHRATVSPISRGINILNDLKPDDDPSLAGECIGPISCELPHVPVLESQFKTGQLNEPIYGEGAKQYHRKLYKIVIEELLSQKEK